MALFFSILSQVALPIVLVAALGFVVQRKLALDVATLNRLLVHVVLPCFLLHYLSTANLPLSAVSFTAWFTVVQFLVLTALGWAVAAVLRLPSGSRPVVGLAAAFANSGNFGIPVVQLAFGQEYLLHQAVIVSLHSILVTSLGMPLLAQGGSSWRTVLRGFVATPILPAVALGLLLRFFELRLPMAVGFPIQLLGNGYTPIALFALGAQLASIQWRVSRPLMAGLLLRLAVAPLATALVVRLWDVPRGLGDLLIVTAAAPVGVLLAVVATQRQEDDGLAAALVFVSTVLSPLTVTLAIYATRFA